LQQDHNTQSLLALVVLALQFLHQLEQTEQTHQLLADHLRRSNLPVLFLLAAVVVEVIIPHLEGLEAQEEEVVLLVFLLPVDLAIRHQHLHPKEVMEETEI
jgi:hypothetical protein